MEAIATTPFGRRPVTAALVERIKRKFEPAPLPKVQKWSLFRELCAARSAYNVSDRDLAVLNALLTFHRGDELTDDSLLVVFPSNATLSERAHGMPESTLRRHISSLIDAGLIRRQDSPNGKRYATKTRDGQIHRAFGFDLRPLLEQADEIVQRANEIRAAEDELRLLREDVVLLKRDVTKLVAYGQSEQPDADWNAANQALIQLNREIRRKLDLDILRKMKAALIELVDFIHFALGMNHVDAEEMSGRPAENERHYTSSNKDSCESEQTQTLPLSVVLQACPDVTTFADRQIKTWRDLVVCMAYLRNMIGINGDTWNEACRFMGDEQAAVTCAGILQRIGSIQSPGGYLRSLTKKATQGAFSPAPMIMALLRSHDKQVG